MTDDYPADEALSRFQYMIEAIAGHVKRAAKAYVAVATPIISAAVTDLATELSTALTGLIAVLIGGLATYRVPNTE